MKYFFYQLKTNPSLGTVKAAAGFTLIELITAIALGGTGIALLLPAVQAAREAAR